VVEEITDGTVNATYALGTWRAHRRMRDRARFLSSPISVLGTD
jgi:hypothetical protein